MRYIPSVREHLYASTIRDEVWIAAGGDLTKVSERSEKGLAHTKHRAESVEIEATDSFAGFDAIEAEIESAIGSDVTPLVSDIAARTGRPLRIRIVRLARKVIADRVHDLRSEQLLVLSAGSSRSIVTRVDEVDGFRDLLETPEEPPIQLENYRSQFLEWSDGSAAVLMHEAVGHPAEQGRTDVTWPEWLSVSDRPSRLSPRGIDDCGVRTRDSELTVPPVSLAWRRSSFRDAPLRRMSSISVAAHGVIALVPSERVRIRLISGGRYDGLSDMVTLGISAAELVTGRQVIPLSPFTIREKRATVARSLMGQCGPESAYPGVACFDEGQRLFVESRACAILTRPFAELR